MMAEVVSGLFFIDKPVGPTSHDIVRELRRVTDQRRIGHTGTLDPLASGLLILCIGRATRLSEYLTGLPKSYFATVRLGQETDTYDAEGEIVCERPVKVTEKQIQSALERFRGSIEQVPPVYSAIKMDGQPLYKRARQGQSVEPAPRTVTVYKLQIESWESPHLLLTIDCSSGTYIRSLAHDLGRALACGGHVAHLRRTAIGSHSVENAAELVEITPANWRASLRPTETAVGHLPSLRLSQEDAVAIAQGQTVPVQDEHVHVPLVQAYDKNDRFIGVLESENDFWHGKKVFYDLG